MFSIIFYLYILTALSNFLSFLIIDFKVKGELKLSRLLLNLISCFCLIPFIMLVAFILFPLYIMSVGTILLFGTDKMKEGVIISLPQNNIKEDKSDNLEGCVYDKE